MFLRFPSLGKTIAKVLIGLAGLIIIFNFSIAAFRPVPAKAFPGEAMAAAVFREVRQIFRDIRFTIKDKIAKVMKVSADVAFKNALSVFLGKLAEDTATWVASAGTGQSPLFISDKKYFQNLGYAAAGDFLDTYVKDVFGTSLCQPYVNQQVNLIRASEKLVLGNPLAVCQNGCSSESTNRQARIKQIEGELAGMQEVLRADQESGGVTTQTCRVQPPVGPPPATGWSDSDYYYGTPGIQLDSGDCVRIMSAVLAKEKAQDNQSLKLCLQQCNSGRRKEACSAKDMWKNLEASKVTAQVSLFFEPEQNDIGQLAKIYGLSAQKQTQSIEQEKTVVQGGIKPTETKVSGQPTSPAVLVQKKAEEPIENATKKETTYTGSIAADTIRIFTNTLSQKLMERFFKGKCGLNPAACKGPSNDTSGGLIQLNNIAAAKLQFANLRQIDYVAGDTTKTEDVIQIIRNRGVPLDDRLAQAINEKKTVKEALDVGLLDPTKTFGFDAEGNEPSDGYPYRLILYLRHYRIVPVGWELAAEYMENFDRRDIGLGDLMKLFSDCGQQVGTDVRPVSAYCGLIDPNWVLKAPATYCKRQGSGEEIITRRFACDEDNDLRKAGNENSRPPDLAQRDGTIDCGPDGKDIGRWEIARNTDYCTDEQSCIAENDDGSCKQYGYCFAEKPVWRFNGTSCPNYYASCRDYTSSDGANFTYLAKTTDSAGCTADNAGCKWYCELPRPDGTWGCTTDFGPKINLDRDAEQCPASADGCTEFLGVTNGANVIWNSNFEEYFRHLGDTFDTFKGWTSTGSTYAVPSDLNLPNITGKTALQLSGGDLRPQIFPSLTSLYYRRFVFSYYAKAVTGTCTGNATLRLGGVVANERTVAVTYDSTWQRVVVATDNPVLPPTPVNAAVEAFIGTPSCDIVVDNAQLEDGGSLSDYKDYGAAQKIYLTKNRASCSSSEIGCELYTPVLGGLRVPAVVNDGNRCSADAVGCKAFREMPIERIPKREAVDPTFIIPATGKQCTAAAVGCEEYTNLDEQARGGEAREYYSRIKQCVRPVTGDATQVTYFSWEGSETQGFQLRSYRLKQSNFDAGPCTNLSVGSITADPQCADNAANRATCTDLASNPDCTEFFDTAGNLFPLLRSRTINVLEDCHPARNSIDQTLPGNDPDLGIPYNQRIFMISPSESARCAASQAGCREFKGNNGNNTRIAYSDGFESGSVANWTLNAGGGLSTEATAVGGHSLLLTAGGSRLNATVVQPQLSQEKSYVLSFWAKPQAGSATISQIYFDNGTPADDRYLLRPPGLILTSGWNLYTVGPVTFDRDVSLTESLFLDLADGLYLDNFQLKELTDNTYLINGSAQSCLATEANCEAYADRAGQKHYLTSFASLCSEAKVGCAQLYNTLNSSTPFALTVKGRGVPDDQFTTQVVSSQSFCKAEDKGCQMLGLPTIDETGTVVDWRTQYLKNNPDEYEKILCLASENFCSEYASKLDNTKSYFRDPGSNTCSYERLPDQIEFTWVITGTTTPCPSTKVMDECELRNIGGQDRFCYRSSPEGVCLPCTTRTCEAQQSGCTEYRDPSEPANCRADCPLELEQGKPLTVDANCRELRASDGGLPGCSSYFFLKQSVDGSAGDCGTQVNLTEGCRPFFDTSNPIRNFRGA